MDGPLVDIFHPLIAAWFTSRYGRPTEAQERAWPVVAAGRNLLLSAPTGTGKTYSAFLYAINQLIAGRWESGSVRVLYISPLKALNTDIRVNLSGPLAEIGAAFRAAGAPPPEIKVQTRSGDTPEAERRRMVRRPPEILITTPESLNLILSSPVAREMLTGIKTVILDEIHSVLGSKRGTHLITAVDRLVPLCGEFQRIGLSATVRPIEGAAAFLGGFVGVKAGDAWSYEPRPVEIVQATQSKRIALTVRYPGREEAAGAQSGAAATAGSLDRPESGESFWQHLAGELRDIIVSRRSTLIFVNSRRLAERLTHEINEGQPRLIAYPHHGSLSRELRSVVEKRLKGGELSAIVATSSLELGIDIGDLDEVLLVETPMSVAGSVQRVGRAGHSVGETSTGTLFASHGMDLLRAVVVSKMVVEQEIEETNPVIAPLDVLAQLIISMTSTAAWKLEDLFGFLRTSLPYHTLSRRQFDLVVGMLEGRFEEARLRELRARVSVDHIDGTIRAREGARYLLYAAGGTIPDRGYYGLHARDSGAKIGELDEEFVWERRVGDAFVLGSQRWKIVAVDHQRVTVVPWKGGVNSSPFWKAERSLRSFHFSARILSSLEEWESALAARARIVVPAGVEEPAGRELERFLARQRAATRSALPHRHHVVAEHTGGKGSARYLLLHTLWGGSVNEPLALAISALLRRELVALDVSADNDAIVIVLPQEISDELRELPADGEALGLRGREILERVAGEDIERLIQEELESSGFFGARFRENAGRALLLPRLRAGRRTPLWVTRLRAKRLLERVQHERDFPIVAETWRECVRDDFDLASLSLLLDELRSGRILVSDVTTSSPSPFASSIVWLSTNQYLYSDDTPAGGRSARRFPGSGGSLSSELMREMIFTTGLEVRIPRAAARRFEAKLTRTAPGYAPHDERELLDWLKERLLIPLDEWRELLEAVQRDGGPAPSALEEACATRIVGIKLSRGPALIAALEHRARIERALSGGGGPEALSGLVAEWLLSYGPLPLERVAEIFGAGADSPSRERFEAAVGGLYEEESLARGTFLEDSTSVEICDTENLERLLAFVRSESRAAVETLPFAELTPFLADWQGVGGESASHREPPVPEEDSREEDLPPILEHLLGFPAKAALWESDILPARLRTYRRHWLDRLLRDTELEWFGCGRERLSFRFHSDAELFDPPGRQSPPDALRFPEAGARYPYWDLQSRSGLPPGEFTRLLWSEVWKGHIESDSFEPVRRGALNGFRPEEVRAPVRGASRRTAFGRWRAQTPLAGNWYLPRQGGEPDALEEAELAKDRVRLLLDRYGVLFKELLERELPRFRWGHLFRTLRLLELSGELVSGRFFDGIPGLQFASPVAVERLAVRARNDRIFWLNATDPVSPCGLGLPAAAGIPARIGSTHLVFHGSRLVLVSKRLGAELRIEVPPDCPELGRYLALLGHLLDRDYDPPRSIKVEKINGKAVRLSPYHGALAALGFEEDFKAFTLRGGRNR